MLTLQPIRRGWRKWRQQWIAWTVMFRRLQPYLAKRRGKLLLSLVLGIVYTLFSLAEPLEPAQDVAASRLDLGR
jgi:hypothetical protein